MTAGWMPAFPRLRGPLGWLSITGWRRRWSPPHRHRCRLLLACAGFGGNMNIVQQFDGIRRRGIVLLCGLLAGVVALPLLALEPTRPIAHFSYVWYENQLPQGTVLSIAQQADGVLWLATYGGLVRHSGEGFQTIDPRIAPTLKSSAITAVAADGAHGLWVGTLNGGLYRYRGRALEPVALPVGI